jgi:hypothetical protein
MERKETKKKNRKFNKKENKSTNGQMDIAQSIRPFSQQHPRTKEEK